MSALTRKLLRDLWHLRGQALAIAVVLGCGVATLVMALGTHSSLAEIRRAYYDRYRFADVFAAAKRAPLALAGRLADIPGVSRVETRIVGPAILDLPGVDAPARGQLVSLPDEGEPGLNAIALRTGRLFRPRSDDEAVISEAFATAGGFGPGDRIAVVVQGRQRVVRIVGIALSPEYVYAIAPGEIVPDNRRFGVLWMSRTALEAAFDMGGAFNDVSLSLAHGASAEAVIAAVDGWLDPYGGLAAHGRKDQTSHAFLDSELEQLQTMARVIPPIFLAVATFLLNVAAGRLVNIQREQIGLLKAFGYTSRAVGAHYLALMSAIAAVGVVLGWVAGTWLGHGMTALYTGFFSFPFLYFKVEPWVYAAAGAVGMAAAGLGALAAVRGAIRLAPAVAMAPPAPTAYRASLAGRLIAAAGIDAPTRMILRQAGRRPLRSALTTVGVATSVALLISNLFFLDAVDAMLETFFEGNQHQDATISFVDPRGADALYAAARLTGVTAAEGFRSVPVRLSHGHRSRRTAITGREPEGRLVRLADADGRTVPLPPEGLTLSAKLAELLDCAAGDVVRVEVLEGRRAAAEVAVARVVNDYVGTGAYMAQDALHRLMGEGRRVGGAYLAVAAPSQPPFFRSLKAMPAVQGVSSLATARRTFAAMVEQNMVTMVSIYVLFAGLIAAGVVYNAARVALSERGRELASLRVLGFTQGEVAYIFLGELALLALPALPLGCLMGYGLAALMVSLFDSELYRIPFIVQPSTFGWAVVAVLAAALAAGLAVARRLATLDLVAVLKTRE